MRGGRQLALYGSIAATSLLSLLGLNLIADKTQLPGLVQFRDYLIRRNG